MTIVRELADMLRHPQQVLQGWRRAWLEGSDLAWRVAHRFPTELERDDD